MRNFPPVTATLFRSEGIETSKFGKDAFLKGRVIVPADGISEWKEMPRAQKKPKYEVTLRGQEPFGMAGLWKLWKNPKTNQWERTLPSSLVSQTN